MNLLCWILGCEETRTLWMRVGVKWSREVYCERCSTMLRFERSNSTTKPLDVS